MARLDDEQKRYIVRRIACYIPLTKIREEIKERFGLDLKESQVSQYDPTTVTGLRDLGEELKQLFDEVRKAYTLDEESVPIAHRAFRLNRYMEMLGHPIVQNSVRLELAIHEQAAKERGGLYERPRPDTGGGTNALEALRAFLNAPMDDDTDENQGAPDAPSDGEGVSNCGESESAGTSEAPLEVGAP